MTPINRLASKLKHIRQERKLTQEQLGERAGLTREYIARLEEVSGVRVALVSTGSERDDTIVRDDVLQIAELRLQT